MDRRTFFAFAAACAGAAHFPASGQSGRLRSVGFLSNAGPASGLSQIDAFRRGLRDLGWIEGQTVTIEYRFADGRPDRIVALVDELVRAKVDIIFLSGGHTIDAARKATSTIPIVFVLLVDPVSMGFVQSLARPGGNITGLASQFEELITKQLQLLKEAVPNLSRVALLFHTQSTPATLTSAEMATRSLGLTGTTLQVTKESDLEGAFRKALREGVGAMQVLPSPYLGAQRKTLIELAARHRLPAFYELRLYVQDGGLMSYGPSLSDLYGRAATYVDKILKGANPGELAIERPARFELVINRKTATALGLVIPQSLLQRADEVIG